MVVEQYDNLQDFSVWLAVSVFSSIIQEKSLKK